MYYSISRVKLFKSCRRAYQLRYVEGLLPVEKAEALTVGSNYHEKIEELYKTGQFDCSDLSKESAMATAYMKYIYPHFSVKVSEEWLRKGDFIGRADGIAEDGRIVEHKTTSGDIGEEYEYNLQWDEQILMYMWLSGAREVYYTVCRKPTIRQKKGETDEAFFSRMVNWYDEETESKIRYMLISRTDEEVNAFEDQLLKVAAEMKNTDNFYRNPSYCTCWGRRCEYSSICLNYNPDQEYVEFTKGQGNEYQEIQ